MTEFKDRRPVDRLYGSKDLDAVFPEGKPITGVPWPRAQRRKDRQDFDPKLVSHALVAEHLRPGTGAPSGLADFDPRELHATQSSITRAGVAHYMGPQFGEVGETFADRGSIGNRHPFVYTREGQHLLLGGHHRAMAALLKGEPLRALHAEGSWGPKR